jgi:transcriptional regulator with XRE-family HTH domain
MDGLNAKFISNTPGFLEYNILSVLGPADTRYQTRNTKLTVHDMDLRKSPLLPIGIPNATDLTFYDAPVQPPPPGIFSQIGSAISETFSSTPKKPTGDARLRAYWLPWAPDVIAELDLTDLTVDFFFTAGFSGCSFTVTGNSQAPHVCHSNMVTSAYMPLASVYEEGGVMTMHNRKNDLSGFSIPDKFGTEIGGRKHLKAVGQNLFKARTDKNITQLKMEELSGLNSQEIANAEVGNLPLQRLNQIADIYAGILNVPAANLKAPGTLDRTLTREDKYKRVYLGQELKAKVKSMQTGVANDIFGTMSFDGHYGGGQDDQHGISAQASVCGYRTLNGNWRFVSQYHLVDQVPVPQTVRLVSAQCVVCRAAPSRCTCPG